MKKIKTLCMAILCVSLLHAQNPLVKKWDYTYGGANSEYMNSDAFIQTSDGGYIVGGFSASDSGADKSQNMYGVRDFWIVKLDANGIKQWDKDFGGRGDDALSDIQQTKDGGYILAGYSSSGADGNKTEPNRGDSLNPTTDYWIVKIDSFGNIQWQKDYGGTGSDYPATIIQTSDHGYIIGGYSESGIGGDKSQACNGVFDFWIIKMDSLGNKQWDKDYGGNDDDELNSIIQTPDQGYLLGGLSASAPSGTKTEPLKGILDYWLIKIDANGTEEWEKDYGGSLLNIFYSMTPSTTDAGYILAGVSNSPISGDKTQAPWDTTTVSGNPQNDYWIVKIDSAGNKEWDKVYGGIADESSFGNITQTNDKGYLLSGNSDSNAGGDKTENNLGVEQNWIVKTDSIGNKTWDKTIFLQAEDETAFSFQINGGCYVSASVTGSDTGGYKTQPSKGLGDYWIVEFCDTTFATSSVSVAASSASVVAFPNPFTTNLSISVQKQNLKEASFAIYDETGIMIYQREERNLSDHYTKTIDLHVLPSGVYFVEVILDGERTVNKIVKE